MSLNDSSNEDISDEKAIFIPGEGSYILFDGDGEELVAGEVDKVIERLCGIA